MTATTGVTENSWRITQHCPLSGSRVEKHFPASFAVSRDFILSSGPRISDIIVLVTFARFQPKYWKGQHKFGRLTQGFSELAESWWGRHAGPFPSWLTGSRDKDQPRDSRISPSDQLPPARAHLLKFLQLPKIPPPNIHNMNPRATFYIKPQPRWAWLAVGS